MLMTGKTSIYPTQRPNKAESGNLVQKGWNWMQKVEMKLSIDKSRKHKKKKWRTDKEKVTSWTFEFGFEGEC